MHFSTVVSQQQGPGFDSGLESLWVDCACSLGLGLSLGIPLQLCESEWCVPRNELANWRQVVCCPSPPIGSLLTWYMTEGHLTEEKIMLNLVPINFMS